MNRSNDKPRLPPPQRQEPPEPAGAFPEAPDDDAIVEHDPTLRWVLSDYDAPVNITPPPVTPSSLTPPLQPVPPEWSAPLPVIPDAFLAPAPEQSTSDRSAASAGVPGHMDLPAPVSQPARPGLESRTVDSVSPSPWTEAAPAVSAASPGPAWVEATPATSRGHLAGATPADFFAAEPTPPSPTEIIADILAGAAPAVESAPVSSESDLSAEVVEEPVPTDAPVPPIAAEQVAASTLANEVLEDDTPIEPVIRAPLVTAPVSPETSTEPHEVEPEAVEMLESSEHSVSPEPPQPSVHAAAPARANLATPSAPAAFASTPPPVPIEAAHASNSAPAVTPPPASTPPPVPVDPHAASAAPVAPAPAETAAAGDTSRADAGGKAGVFDELQGDGPDDDLPEALARRSLKKKAKPWFEEVFDEDFLRTLPFTTPEQTARETAFIRQSLAAPKGGELLDVGCGYGRHALELANAGFKVTGLDLSLPMLIRAADHAQRRGLAVDFVHADMREMAFDSRFDGAYCMLSSFGYFDEETNLRVASAVCKALKPGGRFLLDIINRDYLVGDLPSRVWWEGDGCVVLEEVDFNFHTSRVLIRRSVVFGNGRQTEQEISLRAYSLHELGRILRQAGLRVLDVSGALATKSRFFGAASRNIVALCERADS